MRTDGSNRGSKRKPSYCRGRVAYFTVKTAVRDLEGAPQKRAYRCPLCHCWHLTDRALTQQGVPA